MSGSNLKFLTPDSALLIEDDSEKTLVVSDLHIGWEINLVEKGIHIPSQTFRLQEKLIKLIKSYMPDRIVFLGDIKQAIPKISYEEWKSVPEFLESIQNYVSDISIILGNHDGDLEPLTPPSIKIFPSGGIVLGKDNNIGLFHGHAWPSSNLLKCEVLIMGHVHPVLMFKDKLGFWTPPWQVWVKAKIDTKRLAKAYLSYLNIRAGSKPLETLKKKLSIEFKEPKLIVMPAFNELLGGISVNRFNKRLIGPLLSSGSVTANNAELYLLDGTYMGTIKQAIELFGS